MREGVELTGFLPEIKALVAQSWAEVVPLRNGSGTRLKILEALALGTPVVSTTKGAEGLELVHGRDLLLADTPEQFAAATLAILSQPGLRTALGAAGHRTVAARYDWKLIGRQLDDMLRSVAATRRLSNAQRAA
jgi:polysaccharide biosynthesis protein PslH